jgi:hypothetical protein
LVQRFWVDEGLSLEQFERKMILHSESPMRARLLVSSELITVEEAVRFGRSRMNAGRLLGVLALLVGLALLVEHAIRPGSALLLAILLIASAGLYVYGWRYLTEADRVASGGPGPGAPLHPE